MERGSQQAKVRKAIIPAAGFGTRFLPATKAFPKEMVPIVDRPAIQYVVEEAAAAGIEEILVITGRGKSAMEDHFDRAFELEHVLEKSGREELLAEVQRAADLAHIQFIRQKAPLGLGHAVLTGKAFAGGEPVAVMLPDEIMLGADPCIEQLIRVYERTSCPVIGIREVPDEDVNRYGIVEAIRTEERLFKVHGMIEKPSRENAPSNLAIIGRYVLTPDLFGVLEELPVGEGCELQLTDALRLLAGRRRMFALDTEGERFDVGNQMGFLQANIAVALKRDDMKAELKTFLGSLCAE